MTLHSKYSFKKAACTLKNKVQAAFDWPRQQESNLYFTLRRHAFYPLNYGESSNFSHKKRQ